jgi:hypothetical protein
MATEDRFPITIDGDSLLPVILFQIQLKYLTAQHPRFSAIQTITKAFSAKRLSDIVWYQVVSPRCRKQLWNIPARHSNRSNAQSDRVFTFGCKLT